MYIEVWEYILYNLIILGITLVSCYYDIKTTCPNKIDFTNKIVRLNVFTGLLVIITVMLLIANIPNKREILYEVCEDRISSKIYEK